MGAGLAAVLFTGFISLSAAPSHAATASYPQSFSTGWNLAGNSLTTPIDVKTTFGSQAGITTIWKWDAAGTKWAFYAPSLDTAGTLANYAATKGYNVLTAINPGDGFWVNASAPIPLGTASGTGFSLAVSNLVTGWNLVATADNIAPATFTNNVAFTTNTGNVTTLWAWDNANSAWYFYAPSLAANSMLASYILNKNYKDFGTLTLGNGLGFWVNYAGVATDITSPIPGSTGAITFSSVTDRSLALNIAGATDDVTSQAGLQYRAYYSTSNNLGTVATIEANGTPVGAYTNDPSFAPGKVNGALNFNGSTQYVNVPNSASLNFGTGSFSMEAWVNSAVWVNGAGVASKGGSAPIEAGYTLRQILSGGLQYFQFVAGDGAKQVNAAISNNTAGAWYHLVGVLDRAGNTINLYVNGVLASSASIGSFGSTDSTQNLTLGQQNNIFFSGILDEVALYNRALSPAEISARYNTGNGLSVDSAISSLVAGWRLDDKNLPLVADVLGSNNGNTVSMNTVAIPVAGLSSNTIYYFNVIAKDTAGNKSAYAATSIATPQDTIPPIPGSTGAITFSSVTDKSLVLNIAKATDNATSQAGLQYRTYFSTSNNLGTVAAIEANGTPAGAYITDLNFAPGKVNGALNFDGGTQYVNIPNSASLNFGTGSFSVEAWVNSTVWVNGGGIVGKGGTSNAEAGYSLRQTGTPGVNNFQFLAGNGTTRVSTGVGGYATGTWYHLVGVMDRTGGIISLYVNGALASSANIAAFSGSTDSTLNLTIGKQGVFFNGILDEVALYNRVLSPAEISARYNAGNGLSVDPTMSGLTAGWRLDDKNVLSVADILGNNNGNTVSMDTLAIPIGGLNSNTAYFFNVIAKDAAGNKAAYTAASTPTLLLTPPIFSGSTIAGYGNYAPAVADINKDGNLEALGTVNNGTGDLSTWATSSMGLQKLFQPGRVNRDCRVADFNGDGLPDIICNTYQAEETYPSNPLNPANANCQASNSSYSANGVAMLFFQNPDHTFTEQSSFTAKNIMGFGETIVVADFNNDGALDIFIPYYSQCSPNEHSYLLINDGHGNFTDISDAAGVALRNRDINLRVEGAQALDFNLDGWLDFYVAGHFFINNGCSGNPCNPTFTDQRVALGLPNLFDEGIKFLDWNNDGYLDLIIHHPVTGPALYQFNGTKFTLANVLPAFTFTNSDSYGINVYDLNNDGKEDIITAGGSANNTYVLLNNGTSFTRATTSMDAWGNDMIAFGDINKDGKIDVLKRFGGLTYYKNQSTVPGNSYIYIDVVGSNGEENQQGRVVKIMPQNHAGVTMTRIVESGSGYMEQNMYELLVGTPYPEMHTIQVYFNSVPVTLTANPGDRKRVYPNGTVVNY